MDDQHDQFQAIVNEGHLLTRTSLQASLDAADAAAQSISVAVVMQRAS